MKSFKPLSRYLLVELPQKDEEKTTVGGIHLPDDYKPKEQPYVTVKVLAYANDVKFKEELDGFRTITSDENITMLVDRSMLEEITHDNRHYTLILDNYVKGVFI
tara:strand:+ start:12309 stop:12620 length:312 start_codon:yes stop_codon:yes gene_type:complete